MTSSKYPLYVVTTLLLLILDLGIKQIVVSGIYGKEYMLNRGIGLGIGSSNILSMFLAIIILISLLVYIISIKKSFIPLIFILSGGIGNIISRVVFGGVVDYIKILSLPWFNLADILVFIGIVLLIILNESRK